MFWTNLQWHFSKYSWLKFGLGPGPVCGCGCVRERTTDSLKAQPFQLLDYRFYISAPTPWILCPFLHWEFICCGSYLRSLALLTPLPTGPRNLASFQIWCRDMNNSSRDGNIPKSHLRRRRRQRRREEGGDLCTGLFTKAPSIFALQILYASIMINCYRELGII